jgi:hypothetical protein
LLLFYPAAMADLAGFALLAVVAAVLKRRSMRVPNAAPS